MIHNHSQHTMGSGRSEDPLLTLSLCACLMIVWTVRIGFLGAYYNEGVDIDCTVKDIKKLHDNGDIILNIEVIIHETEEDDFPTTIQEVCDSDKKCNRIIRDNWVEVGANVTCTQRISNIMIGGKSEYTRPDLTPRVGDIVEFVLYGFFVLVTLFLMVIICHIATRNNFYRH